MRLSFHVVVALVLLPLQSVYAQGVKRDILGVSLGMPLPEAASREMIASAGEWAPPQEQLVPAGNHKCKKIGAPWKLFSGELRCEVSKLSHLSLDIALRTEPPVVHGITYNFCSTEEPSKVLEAVYRDYGIANGVTEVNVAIWGPQYRLDNRTILTIGYSGRPCSEGRAYELKLQDFQIRTANINSQQELTPKRQERSIAKKQERKITQRQKRSRLAAATRKR